jgi:hypothetical protein
MERRRGRKEYRNLSQNILFSRQRTICCHLITFPIKQREINNFFRSKQTEDITFLHQSQNAIPTVEQNRKMYKKTYKILSFLMIIDIWRMMLSISWTNFKFSRFGAKQKSIFFFFKILTFRISI